ncbi:hypothetical protein DV515_00017558 [Chloebia gouldiae]|uniref:Uncharacterized protein n=1 Tax=Chloebia gouldiae TaxID=44316 RepID=A0A3L8Q9Y4_CHLGU|nr:hypothetical protein DV515_00017559 [Chloebia gouldiae]RLV64137.1 hypothetical protein DV515_00017550 [Chloebia gouldiae]RLV64140.1 hypothetical protein DV515_00017558 [Chloebia gouldiae]
MPWPPLFGVPPMPVPPAGFAGLTEEELRAMEGHERQHLEARLQCLHNIHTLLDAAMLQINQYLGVLASHGTPRAAPRPPPGREAPPEETPAPGPSGAADRPKIPPRTTQTDPRSPPRTPPD